MKSRGGRGYQVENVRTPTGCIGTIFVACPLAQEFDRPPSVETLCERFGMSRSTAYRWRRGWIEARALLAAREGVPA